MAMLELSDVSKRYGEVTALEPLELLLEPNKTYVLLGTSGCGKSTLLKIALGLVQTDTGSVRIGGELLQQSNELELRRKVGYVIQEGGLFPHLTARENITLVARHLQWDEDRIESRVEDLRELTQLDTLALQRYPAQLSGGQRQRVGLMRALLLDPGILLMDEPLGALDPLIRSGLQKDLRAIFKKLKKTVVIVTHDLHEAAFFADEILLLRSGRVLQRGSIQDLIKKPSDPFVAEFVSAQNVPLTEELP